VRGAHRLPVRRRGDASAAPDGLDAQPRAHGGRELPAKDLLVDWRRGERFFMQRLVDGDPASNDGGWQWAASTGTDAQPWFRVFNPVSQGERFDPDGEYVRRWVPELCALAGASVHRPWDAPLAAPDYPPRIVDHAERRELAVARYRDAFRSGRALPSGSR
jgi:deoxyribodipyrimidine photo-lyase